MSVPLFSLRAFDVVYRDGAGEHPALLSLDLDIAAGRHLAILGESGSGKSTLAMALAGLLPPGAERRGALAAPGFAAPPRLGRDIGLVFQDPSGSLDPLMRVGDQIAEARRVNRGGSRGEARAAAEAWLGRVAIPEPGLAARRYPHQFSGGQKQRIALAAALAGDPSVLIADEPTSALDTVTQHGIVALLRDVAEAGGLTLIFVTHDIALASGIADDIAILHRGRLVESGPASEVFEAPFHPYTRALLATRLTLGMRRRRRFAEIDPRDFSVRVPGEAANG
ncbi:ABC transporter ATP-binding protein [Labrys monachus]|uniref:Peptide/nickel transport system ATP-binding protein n=1 Tax=Labrys monachus TaxID=217067 RepID=A0ABU0F9H6_9HYPH|nr:ABC transporter ATP-binding protein [Labrys monachus]MDQ0391272.1 peptide/nickel transport system ATP-binding protein [Labrys monachus]